MEKMERTTSIGEIADRCRDAADVLPAAGMHCLGCQASSAETLEDACFVYGMETQPVLDAVQARIAGDDMKQFFGENA